MSGSSCTVMEQKEEDGNLLVHLPHHIQQEVCTTRAAYRQGRKLTAVKVYTVNNESVHLLVYRVPAINLYEELKKLCGRYGEVAKLYKLELVDPGEEFTEIYHVCYSKIRQARKAKRELDGRSFYGGLLHVCYAPELETVEETRSKLINRRNEVAYFTGRKFGVPHVSSKSSGQSNSKSQRRENRTKFLVGQQLAVPAVDRLTEGLPLPSPQPSTSARTEEAVPAGPYDLPTPSHYPSSEVLKLPGQEVKRARDFKLTPTSVVKRHKPSPPNRIIFHRKDSTEQIP